MKEETKQWETDVRVISAVTTRPIWALTYCHLITSHPDQASCPILSSRPQNPSSTTKGKTDYRSNWLDKDQSHKTQTDEPVDETTWHIVLYIQQIQQHTRLQPARCLWPTNKNCFCGTDYTDHYETLCVPPVLNRDEGDGRCPATRISCWKNPPPFTKIR